MKTYTQIINELQTIEKELDKVFICNEKICWNIIAKTHKDIVALKTEIKNSMPITRQDVLEMLGQGRLL